MGWAGPEQRRHLRQKGLPEARQEESDSLLHLQSLRLPRGYQRWLERGWDSMRKLTQGTSRMGHRTAQSSLLSPAHTPSEASSTEQLQTIHSHPPPHGREEFLATVQGRASSPGNQFLEHCPSRKGPTVLSILKTIPHDSLLCILNCTSLFS